MGNRRKSFSAPKRLEKRAKQSVENPEWKIHREVEVEKPAVEAQLLKSNR